METSLLFLCFLLYTSSISAEVSLGSASTFAVLSLSSITNTGTSILTGDIGTAGTSITGFPPGVASGNTYLSTQASPYLSDAQAAYNTLKTYTGVDLSGQDLGSMILEPGTYTFTSAVQLTGILTLSSASTSNASWYFIIGTALTVAPGSEVVLKGTAKPSHIFWAVGSSATIEAGTQFVGSVLAGASITMDTGASSGGLFALGGGVTLDTNAVQAEGISDASSSLVQSMTVGGGGGGGGGGGIGTIWTTAMVGSMPTSVVGINPGGPFQPVVTTIPSAPPDSPATTPFIQVPGMPSASDINNDGFPTLSNFAENQASKAPGESLASTDNQANLVSNQIFQLGPSPSQIFNLETNTEMQFSATEIQLVPSMAYSSIIINNENESNTSKSQLAPSMASSGINNSKNNTSKPQLPEITPTTNQETVANYISCITVLETVFSTVPCTSQHYSFSSVEADLATPSTETAKVGSNEEVLTIIETLVITTTCSLPHILITANDVLSQTAMMENGEGGSQLLDLVVIATGLQSAATQATVVASPTVESVASITSAWSYGFDLVFSFLFILGAVYVGF